MTKIATVKAREILDSRGLPTLEVDVQLEDGSIGIASIPSGKSTGQREAVEKRDGDRYRFFGHGVLEALASVEQEIRPAIRGLDAEDQEYLDSKLKALDGTPDKKRLGANAILGISLASARAAAKAKKVPLVFHLAELYGTMPRMLPIPMMNVINGGKHADSGLSIQEFMLVPHGAKDMAEAIRMGAETYYALRQLLQHKGYRVSVGDEGGFAPQVENADTVLTILQEAVREAGYDPGRDVSFALDFAANDFYREGLYHFEGKQWTSDTLIDYCMDLAHRFPIVSVEDVLAEQDWEGWTRLTQRVNQMNLLCVGDDIFVTNESILRKGVAQGIANAILIKPNQIGTLSETLNTMRFAEQSGYGMVISHRSGETDDAFISDLAVATNAGQMKAGAPARGERVAKYNQLLRLAEQLPGARLAASLHAFRPE